MRLSALEIKQQTFAKSLRGYDTAEVHSFLKLVSGEWEHLTLKIREQDLEIGRLNEKLQHYQKVEEALHETLQTAKESSEQRLRSSRQEAQNRIDKAELEAEKIVRDAHQERQAIRQSIQRLLERRHEIIRGMESYLELAAESLQTFKRDDSSTYTLPAESDSSDPVSRRPAPQTGQVPGEAKSPPPGTEDLDNLLDHLDE